MFTGPNTVKDGLILALDAANPRSISALGNNSFNGAGQLTKNLISPSDIIQSVNGVNIGNLDFYTAFAIDYPEGNFGGDAAGRQGITPGLDVRSGTKLYDASRSLHLWVFNNNTNSWLPSSFFNGERLNGHCYDSYLGTPSVDLWVNDYNNIKNVFGSDITVIAMGSHRDSFHTTAQYNILRDLGAPSNVDSIINFSSPEWILVGKPGLGAGNAYGWVFQNHTTNPTNVAHLNFGLPIYGNKDNYFIFDGTDNTINATLDLRRNFTLSCWIKYNVINGFAFFGQGPTTTNQGLHIWNTSNTTVRFGMFSNDTDFTSLSLSTNTWYNFVFTYNHSSPFTKQMYLNGTLMSGTQIQTQSQYGGTGVLRIGATYSSGGSYANGRIADVKIYDKILTSSEVIQNYNATKRRYGL
jgi:hypothetical protein